MLRRNDWNLVIKYDKNLGNEAYQIIQIAVHMYDETPLPHPVTDRNAFLESILCPPHFGVTVTTDAILFTMELQTVMIVIDTVQIRYYFIVQPAVRRRHSQKKHQSTKISNFDTKIIYHVYIC